MTFDVGRLSKKQTHLLADFVELCLVVRYDGLDEVSQARLEGLLKEVPVVPEEVDLDDDTEHAIDRKEAIDKYVEDCWSQLEYRQAVFGHYYPFVVKGTVLQWRPGMKSERECLYLFLLTCSRLRSFKKIRGYAQRAAKAFTAISHAALQALVGPASTVRIFDVGSNDRRTHYGTNLRDAMKKLADDIGAHARHDENIAQLPTSGDHGLDLVAVHHFGDGATGALAVFGQCGAQEEGWIGKTLEAHPLNFKGLFSLLHEPSNVMFIPLSYRSSSGNWFVAAYTSGCLLLDRLRILKLLGDPADTVAHVRPQYVPVLQEVIKVATIPA